MPDSKADDTTSLRGNGKSGIDLITGIEIAAAVLSIIWICLAIFLPVGPSETDGPGPAEATILSTIMTIILPIAMIWVLAVVIRSNRIMREESARLQATIDGLRQAYLQQAQRGNNQADQQVAQKLDEIASSIRKNNLSLEALTARQIQPATEQAEPIHPEVTLAAEQGALELGSPAAPAASPLGLDDFVRALNFPENAEDKAGFDAMRRALRDRQAAQLIQASQDVLTLLSQEGIYMDDLQPDMARPEVWRQFAQGTRGREVAALGGVRDKVALAQTAGRMKQDPIFRDAAHHFLRLFDRMFVSFETEASDSHISALSDTRSARAFMLLGRVTGTFD